MWRTRRFESCLLDKITGVERVWFKLLVLEASDGTMVVLSEGSNPSRPTKPSLTVYKNVDKQCALSAVNILGTYGVSSSIGRAPDCDSGSWRFEPALTPFLTFLFLISNILL